MHRIVLMFALVATGELIFALPFNVQRFFKPTMLDVFNLTNTQLGDMFAVYGVAAALAYFPGGALADHFSARNLISLSLFATALGGLYMATIPGPVQMTLLYGYWGVATIFLFWGALIRATREWGGNRSQGTAFGILEGGRGLVAATAAMVAVSILAFYLPDDSNLTTPEDQKAALVAVILFYTLLTFSAAVLAWFVIPVGKSEGGIVFAPFRGMAAVVSKPVIWAQAGVVVCAYCGYKGLDNYSLYAVQVLGKDEVEGARLAAYGVWARPFAAIFAGLIADRFGATRSIAVIFAVLCLSFGSWSIASPVGLGLAVIFANFFVTHFGVFALRGVYFALMQDNHTPMHLTGAAVGMISFIGFSPEWFFGPITGRILDANPGAVGFQHYFMFLTAVAAIGVVVVVWLIRLGRRDHAAEWQNAQSDAK